MTINDLSCLLHLKIVKNQNDKKVFSDLMKHFNFSNAEQWWQYWDQLMKCWETNSVLFTTLSTQWKVHNTAPPCGVISYTSRSVTCKTAAISQLICGQKCLSSTAGFEPAIFWSVVRRVIRCATRPYILGGHDLTFWTASKWPLKRDKDANHWLQKLAKRFDRARQDSNLQSSAP